MATMIVLQRGKYPAGADLSAKYGFAVKLSAGSAVLGGAGDSCIGVLQNKPTSGQAAEVMHMGIAPVMSGAAFSALDLLASDANGKLQTATAGQKVVAKALAAATAADQLVEALVLPIGIA